MLKVVRSALALLCCLSATVAVAAPKTAASKAARGAKAEEVLLWPQGAPGSEGKTAPEVTVEKEDGLLRLAGIHKPSVTVYLPPKKKATGAAVIIMPGGGHRYLAIENEGHQVAAWLSARGVASFVLKYRLAREEGSTYKVEEHALQDAQRAVRLVRSRAKAWGVDPARVGLIGFSAGGQLAALAGSRFDAGKTSASDLIERESSRPAFQGLMYPGLPAELTVPKDAPPAFLCTAADDKGPSKNALTLFQKLRDGGIDAELHVYARGGHGFGMKDRPMPITSWALRFHDWMGDQGFLKAAPAPRPLGRVEAELDRRFASTVRPFLENHCTGCHGGAKPKADLDLRPFANLQSVVDDFPRWAQVLEKLHSGEMPPKKVPAADQPSPGTRQEVMTWIETVRTNEARKNAGDPGPVLARRLSNAEYNYSIRDLTGVDIRPTREFPVDPSNPAGFDNSGESLAMSPALLKKYLQAAREVASHLVLETGGLAFAPHPMLVETDRDKYCVKRIVDFYQRQATDYAAYFRSAWRFKHRAALGKPRMTLAALAAEDKVSPRYLETIWRTLEGTRETVGPIARLQGMWRQLPAPRRGQAAVADQGTVAMRDFVVGLRKKLEPRFTPPAIKGMPANSQPLVMWRNRQYASHRMSCDHDVLQVDGKLLAQNGGDAKGKGKGKANAGADADDDAADEDAPAPRPPREATVDPDLAIPSDGREKHLAAFDRFCATFPDAFYVSERGRNYLDKSRDKGRLLSAGFHNLMGYFRDDQPLYQLLLDDEQKAELDRLWREMDFVAATTSRTYVQFYFNGAGAATVRAAGQPRPADQEVTAAPAIGKMKALYLAKVPPGAPAVATSAVNEHFDSVNSSLRWVEGARAAAEKKHLDDLLLLAERAYRRTLTSAERDGLLSYYRSLRAEARLDHEEAMRDLLVSVLMSPDFCYRADLVAAGDGVRPLSDQALASRLSYFLWSSLPDAELLARARAGDLHRPEVMAAQARRMLKDPRVRGLATEFGGNWLDFRRFEEHNAVDRERFAAFDNQLRSAMFEEPVRFMLDVFQQGRSVLDFIEGQHTFVNPVLAKHYGMPAAVTAAGDGSAGSDASAADRWVRVANASQYGRGGLLPMAVFLTKNAPGLRTSPVKRGYWVVKNVLGERIPPPPAVVAELPRDEAKMDLPLREVLAQHREDPSCSGCHARFDAMGLVFEGYGPIGEQRSKDLAGRAVDAKATFPGGSEGDGLPGLRQYLRQHRQNDFLDNLSRKLLAYALGRSLLLSDDPTVDQMKARMARAGYRFDVLVESIVTSPQFLTKRGRESLAAR
jgi:acetyl esterase/lipase